MGTENQKLCPLLPMFWANFTMVTLIINTFLANQCLWGPSAEISKPKAHLATAILFEFLTQAIPLANLGWKADSVLGASMVQCCSGQPGTWVTDCMTASLFWVKEVIFIPKEKQVHSFTRQVECKKYPFFFNISWWWQMWSRSCYDL